MIASESTKASLACCGCSSEGYQMTEELVWMCWCRLWENIWTSVFLLVSILNNFLSCSTKHDCRCFDTLRWRWTISDCPVRSCRPTNWTSGKCLGSVLCVIRTRTTRYLQPRMGGGQPWTERQNWRRLNTPPWKHHHRAENTASKLLLSHLLWGASTFQTGESIVCLEGLIRVTSSRWNVVSGNIVKRNKLKSTGRTTDGFRVDW